MIKYKIPREVRALFIIHYMPLLLIMFVGPMTFVKDVYKIFAIDIISIVSGCILLICGYTIFISWSIFWTKNYHGQLITTGPFKHVRHPHYTSILILGFGLALFSNSSLALIIAITAIPIMIISIIDEEKELIRKYGEKYKKYREEVPYRLIPKIF
ncbi:MAG: isoprenylcysteine carboxylmethyltransferase family protein [Thermoplasmata archaeon]|nr:isoprenylcysteine carboxylmethyltransferase family protein [Thermoplasmata archaeon]